MEFLNVVNPHFPDATPNSEPRNDFLEILAKYLTDYLEDVNLSSWDDCSPLFWEEFLFCYFPFQMDINPNISHTEKFLTELKKFARWLDRKRHTSFYKFLAKYIEETRGELKDCEILINGLYLHKFPNVFSEGWDFEDEFQKDLQKTAEDMEVDHIYLKVKEINGPIVVGACLNTNLSYYIVGLPINLPIPTGTIISGQVTRKKGEYLWSWKYPENVFPSKAKKYLENVMI
ncbi:hypothetical protein BKP37_08720 [Anaerobacillus alkalilacustris]|uniref:Uncharacterized protein n=1 Tax=Anaerobacillus alkalilacustris TaxID=393763 RepID=A0A1S2LPY5_9BACI|nr:hypothetical protein [Anaerobacillus alkalilacustris]OIJ14414.1 hypothetical protein BKP37_08720 [Anaerobacillus alkalilacustris]